MEGTELRSILKRNGTAGTDSDTADTTVVIAATAEEQAESHPSNTQQDRHDKSAATIARIQQPPMPDSQGEDVSNKSGSDDDDDSDDDIDGPTALNTVYNLLKELMDLNWENRNKAEMLVTKFSELHNAVVGRSDTDIGNSNGGASDGESQVTPPTVAAIPATASGGGGSNSSSSSSSSSNGDRGIEERGITEGQGLDEPTTPTAAVAGRSVPNQSYGGTFAETPRSSPVPGIRHDGNDDTAAVDEKTSTPLPLSMQQDGLSPSAANAVGQNGAPTDDGTPRPMPAPSMLLALSPEGPTATPRRPSSPSASFMSAGTLAEINPAEATIIPGGGDDDDSKLRNQHMPALPPLLPSPTDRLYRIHLRQQRSTDGDKGASDSDGLELPPPLSPQDGSDLLGLQQELATIRQENHRLRNDLSQLIEIHKQQQSMVMAYESTLAKALQALRANIASQGDRIGEVRDHYIGRINEESRAMSQLQAENQALRTKLVEAASAIRLSLEFSSGNSGGESERLVGDGG